MVLSYDDASPAVSAVMRDQTDSQLVLALDLALIYVTACLQEITPTGPNEKLPPDVRICGHALSEGIKCYHSQLSGARCEKQTNDSMRAKHPDFVNALTAFLFAPRTEAQHQELKEAMGRCKETCSKTDQVVKFLHDDHMAFNGVMDGGPSGDRFSGFVRSGLLTLACHVAKVPQEGSEFGGKTISSKGKTRRWQELDPDDQTGLEELTDYLIPRFDEMAKSCVQWHRILRTPHAMVFLMQCSIAYSPRVYAKISRHPSVARTILESMEPFIKHAESTTKPEDLMKLPGSMKSDSYDDYFGHYISFIYELGKNVTEEEHKRFLGPSCIPLYRIMVRLIDLHQPPDGILDSVRFKPDPKSPGPFWGSDSGEPVKRLAKNGPKSGYTEKNMILMFYALADKFWNLASSASTPEELRNDILVGRLIAGAVEDEKETYVPLDSGVAQWRLGKENPPCTLDKLWEEHRERQDRKLGEITKEVFGHLGGMDKVQRIVDMDFRFLKLGFERLYTLVGISDCMNPYCAKRPEKSQTFQRCSECSLFQFCSKECQHASWRDELIPHKMNCSTIRLLCAIWHDLLVDPSEQSRATPFELYRRLVEEPKELRRQMPGWNEEGMLGCLKRVGIDVRDDEILEPGRSSTKKYDFESPQTNSSSPTMHLDGPTAVEMVSVDCIAQTAIARFLVKHGFAHEMMGFGSGSGGDVIKSMTGSMTARVMTVMGSIDRLFEISEETRKKNLGSSSSKG